MKQEEVQFFISKYFFLSMNLITVTQRALKQGFMDSFLTLQSLLQTVYVVLRLQEESLNPTNLSVYSEET